MLAPNLLPLKVDEFLVHSGHISVKVQPSQFVVRVSWHNF